MHEQFSILEEPHSKTFRDPPLPQIPMMDTDGPIGVDDPHLHTDALLAHHQNPKPRFVLRHHPHTLSARALIMWLVFVELAEDVHASDV